MANTSGRCRKSCGLRGPPTFTVGFNFGVDFGQLFVIAVAFLLVGWFRHKSWFRRRIAIPASLAIAAVGLTWAIQRIVFYSTHG
jgi:hypothetical protein